MYISVVCVVYINILIYPRPHGDPVNDRVLRLYRNPQLKVTQLGAVSLYSDPPEVFGCT